VQRCGGVIAPSWARREAQVPVNLDTGDVDRLDKRDAKTLNLSNLELSLENGVLENNDPRSGSRTQMSSMRVYRK